MLLIFGEIKERKIFHKNDIFQLNISHYSDENASLLWNRSVTLYIVIKHCLIVVHVLVLEIFQTIDFKYTLKTIVQYCSRKKDCEFLRMSKRFI